MLLFGSGQVGQYLDIFCFLSPLRKFWLFTSPLLLKKVMRRSGTACGDHNPRAIDRVNGVERKKIWQLDF